MHWQEWRALATLLALLLSACTTPTQPPVATLPLPSSPAPSATLPAAALTVPPASATPALPTAGPAVATAGATASATANPTVAGGLVGLWQGNNNSFYLLNIDGSWNWDQQHDNVLTSPENQGRWWLEGDVIHVEDLTGKAPCPRGQIGAYQAKLDGDSLVLTLVNDPCLPRIGQTAGQYSRQPAGP
jgi:hypothetical protein